MVRKNQDCPSCGSKNSSYIFWGYPDDMELYLKAIAKKEIVPGVNEASKSSSKWECNDCKHRWGNREDDEDEWEILYDEDYPFTESKW